MTVFGQKVHSADFSRTGVLSFGSKELIEEFLRDYQPDDWVLYIGATRAPKEHRKRLLALVKLGQEVEKIENLTERSLMSKIVIGQDGNPKWTHGLPVTEA